METAAIDAVRLNLDPTGLMIINAAIAVMMLGVALDLRLEDFRRILASPRAPAIGLVAQFLLLPAFTFALTLLLRPQPSIALGMMLVAACPGGNLSNIMTHLSQGNTAVSISMTALSTIAAVVMTPLNLTLWGRLNPATAPILQRVSLSPLDLLGTVLLVLGLPLLVGVAIARFFPAVAQKARKPFKVLSLIFFVAIVAGALIANWKYFRLYVGAVAIAVALHNALALNIGYWAGRLAKLPRRDCRATAIEVGIQNSALGLVLVFTFFEGLGGMAIVVAWWGIWHIIGGLTAAFVFTRRALPLAERSANAEAS